MTAPLTAREAWDRLMLAFEAAKAADEDINARYNAAVRAHEAERPSAPDIDFRLLGLRIFGEFEKRKFLKVDDLDDWQAKIVGATGVTRWEREDRNPLRIAEIDKVRAYRRLAAVTRARHGLDALENEWEAAGEALSNARGAVIKAQAPDYGAVSWKLDQLFGPEATAVGSDDREMPLWDCAFTDAVIADMARLALEGTTGGAA